MTIFSLRFLPQIFGPLGLPNSSSSMTFTATSELAAGPDATLALKEPNGVSPNRQMEEPKELKHPKNGAKVLVLQGWVMMAIPMLHS